jgi:hypothetical protein
MSASRKEIQWPCILRTEHKATVLIESFILMFWGDDCDKIYVDMGEEICVNSFVDGYQKSYVLFPSFMFLQSLYNTILYWSI